MPTLTIFRGLPGSGKSTMAATLAKKTGAIVVEPDALLAVNGRYAYTPERYRRAVQCCADLLRLVGPEGMGADAIYSDVLPTVADVAAVVSAYNPKKSTAVSVAVFSLAATADDALLTNRHDVREEDVRRMERDWEACPGEAVI